MNNDVQQLQNIVKVLTSRLDELQRDFDMHFHDGNNSQRVNVSDLFNVGPTGTYPTTTTSVPAGGGNVVAPSQPSGTLALVVGDTTYKLLYQ